MQQRANGASAACIIATTVFLVPAAAWAQGAAPMIVNRAPASAGMHYWTADRMAAAVAVDLGLTGAPAAPAVAPKPSGPAGGGGGSLPGQQRASLSAISDQAWAAAITPSPTDGSYPGPNTTFEYGPRFRTYPVSTIGKLFFTEPGVGDFVCSAAVTTGSASINNIIWTAGHCVANGGHQQFYTNWLFCPSYNAGGVNPAVGCWNWSYATTSGEWFNSGAFTRDYAIIGLQHSGTVINADVATVTGSLGFGYNFPRDQNWVHMGYPAASPYDGTRIIATNTEHRYDDTPDNLGPPTNSWGSAQTPGSSGSAVMLFFNYSSPPWINSDVSYYYTNPNQYGVELQGPYFDTQVCTFWKNNTGWPNAC
jgi:hypothetical protein